ncbi:MAG: signal recognition particle-docking protein FtsY [Holosporales bacterium]|jgi:fused signal recognition particle receptor|nr:signal recognition particle-docking protein FtsY [Holosporales bacterium]
MTWLSKLRDGLKKSSQLLENSIRGAFSKNGSNVSFEDVFDSLVCGDMGVETSEEICNELKRQKFNTAEELLIKVAESIEQRLSSASKPFNVPKSDSTHIILMAGVNGSGKTTSIAKLTKQCLDRGLSVEWAACDTFRAGAVDQLCVWGARLGVEVYTTYPGQGAKVIPGALAYSAAERAQQKGTNVLFVDTAGRLQNNAPLMQELGKVASTLKKVDPQAPHQTLLVLDGTVGQNAFAQLELFKRVVPITGLIVSKLDGTSKAGFLVGMFAKTHTPIVAVGVGEKLDDMDALDVNAFARGLVGLEPQH